MSAIEAPALTAAPAASRRGAVPISKALAARLFGFLALGVFCALHWAALLAPYASERLLGAVGLGVLGGVAMVAAANLDGRRRAFVLAAVVVAMVLGALALSGIPLRLLGWRNWDELTSGISDGLGGLPGVTVPYRAADPWPGIAIVAGGTLLIVLAAALAFWPREAGLGWPWASLIVLADVFAVPAVERNLDAQYARGAAFAALVLCYLGLDRVRLNRAGPMLAAAAAAALAGLALAPRLDGQRAWIDYNSIAESLTSNDAVSFNWNHSYGPLDWPRDGTTMLRIEARRAAYWKAENLDRFDGLRWVAEQRSPGVNPRSELPVQAELMHPGWIERLRVTVRSLRSREVIGAGTTLAVTKLGRRPARPAGSAGTFAVRRALGRGDSYQATVYTPHPSRAELAKSGTDYPGFAGLYLNIEIPTGSGTPGDVTNVSFAPFERGRNGVFLAEFASLGFGSERFMRGSPYGRTWTVARRLARESATPYAYARRLLAYFQRGFSYVETPPRALVPLEAFVSRDKVGYCQQFSGAMALMLRMGGVPARVASGFTTGERNPKRGEYIVADSDAHSWVEAYFPGIGWVPFDPTPAVAPARAGARGIDLLGLGPIPGGRASLGDRPAERGTGFALPEPKRSRTSAAAIATWIALGLALCAAAAGLGVGLRRRERAQDPGLAELERALRRTGRPLAPSTTLSGLETRLGPGARGYIDALKAQRFSPAAGGPTPGDRLALRRELARGLGVLGRLRGWWALPPRLWRPPGRKAPFTRSLP